MIEYLIGVDGGGTGTRVAVAQTEGSVLAQGQAGPSALGQGIEPAWQHIRQAINAAFASIGRVTPAWSVCAMGAGLPPASMHPSMSTITMSPTAPDIASGAVERPGASSGRLAP